MASIKKIATELDWEFEKLKTYGTFKGYDMSLVQHMSYSNAQNVFKLLHIPCDQITQGNIGIITDFLNINKKAYRIFGVEISETLITIRFNEMYKGIKPEKLIQILDGITYKLSTLGISKRTLCIYCNKENPDTVTYINDIKFPSHNSCKIEAIGEVAAQQQAMKDEPGNPLAYFGAMVGALIGVIPYTILTMLGWFLGILTILTGTACYKAYKLSKGKVTKSTKWFISIISLVTVVFSNFLVLGVLAVVYEVTIIDLLSVSEIANATLELMGMSVLFGLIGSFYTFSRVKRDEFKTVIK